ncbi:MAG: serine/threonine protein phosphatase, partial [Bacteroidota bacterium]
MSGLSDIRKTLSSIEMLERELNLKQLQIRRLLKVTQAINNNESASDLFSMYEDFLRIDLGVRRMALFFLQDEEWICQASIDIEHKELDNDLLEILPKYREHASLENENHPFLQQFDV